MTTLRKRMGWAWRALRGRPVVTVTFTGDVTLQHPIHVDGPVCVRGGIFRPGDNPVS